MFRRNVLQKSGITVTEIVPEERVQLRLFGEKQDSKQLALNRAIDALNQKSGRNILRQAVQGSDNNTWKLRCDNLSPSYTTRINEVLEINVGFK